MKRFHELKVGDTVKVTWRRGLETITEPRTIEEFIVSNNGDFGLKLGKEIYMLPKEGATQSEITLGGMHLCVQ